MKPNTYLHLIEWCVFCLLFAIVRMSEFASISLHQLCMSCQNECKIRMQRGQLCKNSWAVHISCHSSRTIINSENSSIDANRKSTMGFPTSHQPRSCIAPKIPKFRCHNFRRKTIKSLLLSFIVRNFQRKSCSAINYLSNGINILSEKDSVPIKFAPKGTACQYEGCAMCVSHAACCAVNDSRPCTILLKNQLLGAWRPRQCYPPGAPGSWQAGSTNFITLPAPLDLSLIHFTSVCKYKTYDAIDTCRHRRDKSRHCVAHESLAVLRSFSQQEAEQSGVPLLDELKLSSSSDETPEPDMTYHLICLLTTEL